jgi:hypothetical protein
MDMYEELYWVSLDQPSMSHSLVLLITNELSQVELSTQATVFSISNQKATKGVRKTVRSTRVLDKYY